MQKGNMESPKHRTTKLLNTSTICEIPKANTKEIQMGNVQASSMNLSNFVSPRNLTRIHGFQSESNKSFDEGNTEMELLYDKYLQGMMVEILLKQKAKKENKLMVSQLASMAEEIHLLKKNLFELKTRYRDIRHLTNLQNEVDLQIKDIKNCFKSVDITKVEDVLSQLHIVLQDYDVLRCDNIILPKTPTEWEETIQALKSCCDTLKSMMDLIGSNNESYQCVNDGIKDFLNTYNIIKDHYERLEKDINDLQNLALKTAALSLM